MIICLTQTIRRKNDNNSNKSLYLYNKTDTRVTDRNLEKSLKDGNCPATTKQNLQFVQATVEISPMIVSNNKSNNHLVFVDGQGTQQSKTLNVRQNKSTKPSGPSKSTFPKDLSVDGTSSELIEISSSNGKTKLANKGRRSSTAIRQKTVRSVIVATIEGTEHTSKSMDNPVLITTATVGGPPSLDSSPIEAGSDFVSCVDDDDSDGDGSNLVHITSVPIQSDSDEIIKETSIQRHQTSKVESTDMMQVSLARAVAPGHRDGIHRSLSRKRKGCNSRSHSPWTVTFIGNIVDLGLLSHSSTADL